jgi:hypothetical protein
MFYLSRQCQMCHNFQYFAQHIDIFWENVILSPLFHLLGIDTDPDRHALYAAPDQKPAKLCGSDPIRFRIRIHNNGIKNSELT